MTETPAPYSKFRNKKRPPASGHPWRGASFEQLKARQERQQRLAEIRRRERGEIE